MNNLLPKGIVLFLLCIVTIFPIRAQTYTPIQYGLVTGLNLSNFNTGIAVSTVNAGFNAGGFLRLPLSNSIAIESELYLSTKGTSIFYKSLLAANTANLNLTYLEMPVLCIFNVTNLINFQAGPTVSYLISAQVKNAGNINVFNFHQSPDTDNFNRLDAGVVLGVGLDVKSITMGIRYNVGLIRLGKDQRLSVLNYNIDNARNGVLNFYLAIGFKQHTRKCKSI